MVFGGGVVECPECGETVSVARSEFRYGKMSHSRDCDVWLKIDRSVPKVVGAE